MSNPILDELYEANLIDPRQRDDPRRRVDPRELAAGERIPLGGNNMKLTLPERQGYHRHWINDDGDRIERALRGGYQFIYKDAVSKVGTGPEPGHNDLGAVISKVVGRRDDGSPKRAYAMEIKLEYYNEDQANKHRHVREMQAEISKGQLPAQGQDASNRYIPEEGIRIGDD